MKISITRAKAKDKWNVTVNGEEVAKSVTLDEAHEAAQKAAEGGE